MPNENGFRPIEQKIIDLLSDGMPHERAEVMKCIGDPLATPHTLQNHISNIRRVIRPRGDDVICELYVGKIHYRYITIYTKPVSSTPTKAASG